MRPNTAPHDLDVLGDREEVLAGVAPLEVLALAGVLVHVHRVANAAHALEPLGGAFHEVAAVALRVDGTGSDQQAGALLAGRGCLAQPVLVGESGRQDFARSSGALSEEEGIGAAPPRSGGLAAARAGRRGGG